MDEVKEYPVKKTRNLNEAEKEYIRSRVAQGDADIYELARDFDCSPSQIAGIKAAITRSGS